MLSELLQQILLEESVSVDKVNNAIDKHERIIISYLTRGEDIANGARVIDVYAYGLTKAGNPVIRAFQPYGDTSSRVPSWKFFRLDRITHWEETGQTFDHPASDDYKNIGEFNRNGDKTMSIVYKIASFNDTLDSGEAESGPKEKKDVYQTDTERNMRSKMQNLRQQVDNPITLDKLQAVSDLAKQDNNTTAPDGQPRLKTNDEDEIYKTDTERRMERLRQQLDNPTKIDLSKFDNKSSDSNKEEDKPEDEVFKTDTERRMERLRQQLNNPTKIDLSKIPRK